ncbi:unnamed protein product [Lactuca saligna]|uniref:Uncharacterized protein n=1 Tax=Lactuca saligna TaxID=75948 RepID=A0AA35YKV7_LACSI|nr:unnamed protein product [Lactuca saligna]
MTHLKASSKLRLVSGEESSGSQNLEFVTLKAQKVYETYHNAMKDKYGDDLTLHPLGDVRLWEQCVGGRKKGWIFGVGNSDPSFVVTGTPIVACSLWTMLDLNKRYGTCKPNSMSPKPAINKSWNNFEKNMRNPKHVKKLWKTYGRTLE